MDVNRVYEQESTGQRFMALDRAKAPEVIGLLRGVGAVTVDQIAPEKAKEVARINSPHRNPTILSAATDAKKTNPDVSSESVSKALGKNPSAIPHRHNPHINSITPRNFS